MNDFIHSCNAAASYPKNLVSHNHYQHTLQTYVDALDARERRLFGPENKATLDFWDLHDGATSFQPSQTNPQELEKHLHFPPLAPQIDPKCRFIFLHAPTSRSKLRATRRMLMKTASYHQVMPSFLDFVFSFGAQHHAKDFSFTGFRHDTRLSDAEKGAVIPELGRSGQAVQLCYSLRSVEASTGQERWPWAIRGTATYHTFDLDNGRTNWLIVKGERGTSMKDRIVTETSTQQPNPLNRFGSRSEAFSTAISAHLLLCSWTTENWRWYVNYMEEEVQSITRKTLSVTVARQQTEPKPHVLLTRTATGVLVPPKKTSTSKSNEKKQQSAIPLATMTPTSIGQGPPGPPGPPPSLSAMPKSTTFDPFQNDNEFSFEDLRGIEYIEEHANEALSVLTLNRNVLSALVQHYCFVLESVHCPQQLKTDCTADYRRFESKIAEFLAEIQTQKIRVETLLRLLADRKALLYGILEYRNVEASKELASKAQYSADRVEYMTQQMKQEAVFMRIITLVTLFFLPGTFVSTLMSTDIVHWQTPAPGGLEQVVSAGAAKTFLMITIPCMVLTLFGAYGFYRWSRRREQKELERQATAFTQP